MTVIVLSTPAGRPGGHTVGKRVLGSPLFVSCFVRAIVVVGIYAFNGGRQVTHFDGFSASGSALALADRAITEPFQNSSCRVSGPRYLCVSYGARSGVSKCRRSFACPSMLRHMALVTPAMCSASLGAHVSSSFQPTVSIGLLDEPMRGLWTIMAAPVSSTRRVALIVGRGRRMGQAHRMLL